VRTAAKCLTMWLHNHGVLPPCATTWLFNAFNLGGA
jgi:hypothetical protein